MREKAIIEVQLEFYRKGGAGCLFAAHAAVDPVKFEWRLSVSDLDEHSVENIIQEAITTPAISMQSIIFPSVLTDKDLKKLLLLMKNAPSFILGQEQELNGLVCLGYRIRVGDKVSWVTGFGSFDFLPKTRQAIFTEIVFRSKPRPDYTTVMKDAPADVLHLADLNIGPMRKTKFEALWYGSFDKTEQLLGHKPDLASAAKTTYAVPVGMWE